MKRARRTPMDLIIEILKTCNNNYMNKTRIINTTNLNSKIGTDYIRFLIEKEYLINKENMYHTSENGKKFLEKMNEIGKVFLEFSRENQ